jgi:hypothetical protein
LRQAYDYWQDQPGNYLEIKRSAEANHLARRRVCHIEDKLLCLQI